MGYCHIILCQMYVIIKRRIRNSLNLKAVWCSNQRREMASSIHLETRKCSNYSWAFSDPLYTNASVTNLIEILMDCLKNAKNNADAYLIKWKFCWNNWHTQGSRHKRKKKLEHFLHKKLNWELFLLARMILCFNGHTLTQQRLLFEWFFFTFAFGYKQLKMKHASE